MYENQKLVNTTPDDLINGIYLMKRDDYRLVQISCTRVESGFELNYTFDKDLEFINYRLILPIEDEIVSISRIFSPAFLYENELKDLFGVKISSITIDYDGGLYRVKTPTPMKDFVPPHPPLPTANPAPKPASNHISKPAVNKPDETKEIWVEEPKTLGIGVDVESEETIDIVDSIEANTQTVELNKIIGANMADDMPQEVKANQISKENETLLELKQALDASKIAVDATPTVLSNQDIVKSKTDMVQPDRKDISQPGHDEKDTITSVQEKENM